MAALVVAMVLSLGMNERLEPFGPRARLRKGPRVSVWLTHAASQRFDAPPARRLGAWLLSIGS